MTSFIEKGSSLAIRFDGVVLFQQIRSRFLIRGRSCLDTEASALFSCEQESKSSVQTTSRHHHLPSLWMKEYVVHFFSSHLVQKIFNDALAKQIT